jgi:hypothetical protein
MGTQLFQNQDFLVKLLLIVYMFSFSRHLTVKAVRACQTKKAQGIYFRGGGIYYYWQAGACQYLRDHIDPVTLRDIPVVGASAGSLSATLLKCGVNFYDATAFVVEQAEREKVYEKGSLLGIWGGLVREWLNAMIPDQVECSDLNLHITLTPLNPLRPTFLANDFHDKADLIEACMGSVHIPFFLDWKAYTKYRGRRYV